MVSLNSWSVSVALYYVSVSGHSLSGELHSLRMSVHSLSVSVSELLEYRRKCISNVTQKKFVKKQVEKRNRQALTIHAGFATAI